MEGQLAHLSADPSGAYDPRAEINPEYLHSNSTSHQSPFSAIAELLDNAVDAGASCCRVSYDGDMRVLSILDDGSGMDGGQMKRMLGFGFSEKDGNSIGHYGNGFKSGSMRLGKDVIVISCQHGRCHAGLLSQSYLKQHSTVLVPICGWELTPGGLELLPRLGSSDNWEIIKKQAEVDESYIRDVAAQLGNKGTMIRIWGCTGELEEHLEAADIIRSSEKESKEAAFEGGSVELRRSLRALCEVLYLERTMEIEIFGEPVQHPPSSNPAHPFDLLEEEASTYKPQQQGVSRQVQIYTGFHRNSAVYGACLYSGKRLIQAYERIGMQLSFDSRGSSVVMIVKIPRGLMNPDHSKTKFEHSQAHTNLILQLKQHLSLFWHEHRPQASLATRWHFLECCECGQLRRVPPSEIGKDHPRFNCASNKWDTRCQREGCSMPQEMSTADARAVMAAKSSLFKMTQQKSTARRSRKPSAAPKFPPRSQRRKLGWCVASGCEEPSDKAQLLLCSGCGDHLHASCQHPPAEWPAEGDWQCPDCDDRCALCSRGGRLVKCESCPLWLHWRCYCDDAGMDPEEPAPGQDDSFFCKSCQEQAPQAVDRRPRKKPRKASGCAGCQMLRLENQQLRAQLDSLLYEQSAPAPAPAPVPAPAPAPEAEPWPAAEPTPAPRGGVKPEPMEEEERLHDQPEQAEPAPEPEQAEPAPEPERAEPAPGGVKPEPMEGQQPPEFQWTPQDANRMRHMCQELFGEAAGEYLQLFLRARMGFGDLYTCGQEQWRLIGIKIGPRCRIMSYLQKQTEVIEL